MSPDLRPSPESRLQEVEPLIQGIVRKKLFVTLRKSDFREQNQDALDVLSDIRVKLLQKVAQEESGAAAEPAVADFRGYAATVAFHTCADYIRSRYPQRTNLKNCLRRLLQKADGYAFWSAANGELLCGYVGWQNQPVKTDSAKIAEIERDPAKLPGGVLPKRASTQLGLEEWMVLLDAIFKHVEGPMAVDDLVSIVSRIVGVTEMVDASHFDTDDDENMAVVDTLSSAAPDPHSTWLHQE